MPRPIELTLYDPETNEIKKTYTRSFVPWALLKRAIRMMKSIDTEEMKEEDMDELASLVVACFGDQFSVDEVNKGADAGEMVTVLQEIVSRATWFVQGKKPDPSKAA